MRSANTVIAVLGLLLATPAAAQNRWTAPEGISWRSGTIRSGGTRLAAEIFSLGSNAGKEPPCILMAHGWEGTVRGLRRDAVAFASAGYLAVAFDYRGWGNSDPRLILAGPTPDAKAGRFRAEVIAMCEGVDPRGANAGLAERDALAAVRADVR